MTHVLRIAHLRIALHVANPEVGKREVHLEICLKTELKNSASSSSCLKRKESSYRARNKYCIFQFKALSLIFILKHSRAVLS